jgi:feruloyl esterase
MEAQRYFDPSTLLCRSGEGANCLSAKQVETAKKTFGPLKSKTGELIFPGMEPGSEPGWSLLIGGPEPLGLALTGFKYVIHEDPNGTGALLMSIPSWR